MGGNEGAIRGSGDMGNGATAGATGPQLGQQGHSSFLGDTTPLRQLGPQLGQRGHSWGHGGNPPFRLGVIASKAAKQALESKAN